MSKAIIGRVVREGTGEDIATVQRLAHAVWPPTYIPMIGQEQVEYMLNQFYSDKALKECLDAGQKLLLLRDGAEDLGFAMWGSISGVEAKLHKLYVLPKTQGSGAGRAMLNAVERSAALSGADTLILNVNRNNPAYQFYIHCGYAVIHTVDIPIGYNFYMNDYVMEKRLSTV